MSEPRVRTTARILLIDAQGSALLFFTHWNNRIAPPRWLTPGGGVDAGETIEQAAVRELFEETGLRVDSVGERVWHERRALPAGHEFDEVDSSYFVVRTERFTPGSEGWMPDEFDNILEHRWWSREQIRSSDAEFDPENVLGILDGVL